jgi:hypothetical protein
MGKGNPNIQQYATNRFDHDPERAREAQAKGVQTKKANAFTQELAQRMLNSDKLTDEEKATLKERGWDNPTEWQVAFNASLTEAKNGNYKALETLFKLAGLYVEKKEQKVEHSGEVDITSKEEAIEHLAQLNE